MRRSQLVSFYRKFERDIKKRIADFRRVFEEKDGKAMLKELVFCLLTPQSKARICWNAVEKMDKLGLLEKYSCDSEHRIRDCLYGVRFAKVKSRRIAKILERFSDESLIDIVSNWMKEMDVFLMRDYLVKEINGFGYKEGSHFLRNIGVGLDLAILDRHILSVLLEMGYIDSLPSCLSKKKYLEIESVVRRLAGELHLLVGELDLLLWAIRTGYVFK